MALTKVTGHVVQPDTNIQFHNTKSTGIITATDTTQSTSTTTGALQIAGGVGIAKNLNVGGNANISGVLTYEDVTNIDAVGIITAQAGIHFGIGATAGKFDALTGITTFSGNLGINQTSPTRNLHIDGTAHQSGIIIHTAGNHSTAIDMDSNRSSAGNGLAEINFKWDGTTVGQIGAYAGSDTSNKDDAVIHFDTASAGSALERVRIESDGKIKFSTNNSTTDYFQWGNNPRLWLKCPDGINGLRIDANTTPIEIRNSDATGRSYGIGGGASFDMSVSGDYSLSSSGHDSSPKVFFNATRHNGSTTVTSFQTSIQAVSRSNTSNDGYLGLGGSASPDDLVIDTSGKIGIGTDNPSALLHIAKYTYDDPDNENFFRIKLQDHGGIMNDVGIGQVASGSLSFNNTASGRFSFHNGTNGEIFRIASSNTNGGGVGISTAGGNIGPDGNALLIRAKSTVATTKGHIMLTGDGATNGEGPQIVFSESGSGSNFAGAYIGHIRATTNSVGHLVFGTRETGGDANTVPIERLRITSTGDMGLGSVTPTTPNGSNADNPNNGLVFTMYGDSPAINLVHNVAGGSAAADDYAAINFGRTGSSTNPYRAVIGYKQSDDILRINAKNAIAFDMGGDINSGEKLRITSSGALLVGTTTPSYGSGDIQHEIKKNNTRGYTAPLMVSHSHLLLNNSDTSTSTFCGIGIRAGTGDGAIGFVYGNAANNADFVVATDGGANGIERIRVTNSGALLVGTSVNSVFNGGRNARVQIEGTDSGTSALAITRNSNDQNPAYLSLGKSKGTAVGSNTAVADDTVLGCIEFNGSDGSGSYNRHADIRGAVDGAPGNSDAPGRIQFRTTPDGSTTPRVAGQVLHHGGTTWGPSTAVEGNMQWTRDTNQIPHFFWGGPAGAGQPTDGCVVIASPQTDICSQRVGTILFGSTTSGGSGNTGLKAGINCVTNSSPGSDFNAGGNLIFQTKPNNATLKEQLRIAADGKVYINSANNYGTSPATLNVGRRSGDPGSTQVNIARGEAIGGGTGPVLSLIHGPDGGTQRVHNIYSYVGDLRVYADAAEDLHLRGLNTKVYDANGDSRMEVQSDGDFKVANPTWSSTSASNCFQGLNQLGSQHWGHRQYYSKQFNLTQNGTQDLISNNTAHDDIIFWLNVKGYHANRTFAAVHGTIGGYGITYHSQHGASGGAFTFTAANISTGRNMLRFTSTSSYGAQWWVWGWISGTSGTGTHTGITSKQLNS